MRKNLYWRKRSRGEDPAIVDFQSIPDRQQSPRQKSRPSRSIPATLQPSLGEVDNKKLLQNQQLLNPHPLEEGLLVVVRLILLVAVSGNKTSSGFQA